MRAFTLDKHFPLRPRQHANCAHFETNVVQASPEGAKLILQLDSVEITLRLSESELKILRHYLGTCLIEIEQLKEGSK